MPLVIRQRSHERACYCEPLNDSYLLGEIQAMSDCLQWLTDRAPQRLQWCQVLGLRSVNYCFRKVEVSWWAAPRNDLQQGYQRGPGAQL